MQMVKCHRNFVQTCRHKPCDRRFVGGNGDKGSGDTFRLVLKGRLLEPQVQRRGAAVKSASVVATSQWLQSDRHTAPRSLEGPPTAPR